VPRAPGQLRRRLRRADFQRVTGAGSKFTARYFQVFVHDRGDGGATRLGITVTRRVGNAVRRNRIKRLVREWFRLRGYDLGARDLVIIAKRGFDPALGIPQVREDLDTALASLRG
jgi:ribonuclease P protein component